MNEKEFDKKFPGYFEGAYYEKEDTNLGDELKSFIRKVEEAAYQRGKKEVIEKIPTYTDYPLAWRIIKQSPKDQHHEKCSWRTDSMLCDCAAVNIIELVLVDLKNSLN